MYIIITGIIITIIINVTINQMQLILTSNFQINILNACYHKNEIIQSNQMLLTITRKPRKGAAVIAASMHGFASCRKFKSSVTLTLTLDRVKVTSTYTVHVGLPAGPIT